MAEGCLHRVRSLGKRRRPQEAAATPQRPQEVGSESRFQVGTSLGKSSMMDDVKHY